jgi:hypothetical protein
MPSTALGRAYQLGSEADTWPAPTAGRWEHHPGVAGQHAQRGLGLGAAPVEISKVPQAARVIHCLQGQFSKLVQELNLGPGDVISLQPARQLEQPAAAAAAAGGSAGEDRDGQTTWLEIGVTQGSAARAIQNAPPAADCGVAAGRASEALNTRPRGQAARTNGGVTGAAPGSKAAAKGRGRAPARLSSGMAAAGGGGAPDTAGISTGAAAGSRSAPGGKGRASCWRPVEGGGSQRELNARSLVSLGLPGEIEDLFWG